MSEVLRSWLLSLTGAALLSAFALALTPEGRARSAVKLLCGVVMAIALLSPLRDFDFDTYAVSLASYRDAAAEASAKLNETNDRLSRTIIETESAAYIWDKARAVGLAPEEVTVGAKWGDALCWYPFETTIYAPSDAAARERLSEIIEAELGIPKARQHWELPSPENTQAGGS